MSSLPSDTATLAFAVAAVVWAASRPLGLLCAAWAIAAVGFPRLCIGYPT
ncbi:hypothetical protein [Caldovatus sediminis]|nr:hypothetical protein [Caldovatus sediminis]